MRLLGASRNSMCAVEAARAIRAITRGNSAAQDAATQAAVIEALSHAAATDASALCARDAAMTLGAVCKHSGVARTRAHRAGAVQILLTAIAAQDARLLAACTALTGIAQHGLAADAAVQSGAFAVLLKHLSPRASAGGTRVWLQAASAHSQAQQQVRRARGAAISAMTALVAESASRADAFVSAGGLEALEAAFADLSSLLAAAHQSCTTGGHALARTPLALPTAAASPKIAAIRSPRITGASHPGQHAAHCSAGGTEVVQTWRLMGTAHSAAAPSVTGFAASTAPTSDSRLTRTKLEQQLPPSQATDAGLNKASIAAGWVQHLPELQAAAAAEVCGLAAALADASPSVQARLRGTDVIAGIVRLSFCPVHVL